MANIKFNQEIADRIIAAIKDGATQSASAKRVGITEESLSKWKTKFPAFGEAVTRAHAEAQVFAEQSLYRMAAKGNVKAQELWLRNRCPAEWHDVQRREITMKSTFEDWLAELEHSASAERNQENHHDKSLH
jgi:hypothetical protein